MQLTDAFVSILFFVRNEGRRQGYSQYDSSAERLWCGQYVSDDHDAGCGARTHSSLCARVAPARSERGCQATFPDGMMAHELMFRVYVPRGADRIFGLHICGVKRSSQS